MPLHPTSCAPHSSFVSWLSHSQVTTLRLEVWLLGCGWARLRAALWLLSSLPKYCALPPSLRALGSCMSTSCFVLFWFGLLFWYRVCMWPTAGLKLNLPASASPVLRIDLILHWVLVSWLLCRYHLIQWSTDSEGFRIHLEGPFFLAGLNLFLLLVEVS